MYEQTIKHIAASGTDDVYCKPTDSYAGAWDASNITATRIGTTDSFIATLSETKSYVVYKRVGGSRSSADFELGTIPKIQTATSTAIDGFTVEESLRLLLAVNVGKATATGTTAVFRAANDSKDRVTATVSTDGDRITVTKDAS